MTGFSRVMAKAANTCLGSTTNRLWGWGFTFTAAIIACGKQPIYWLRAPAAQGYGWMARATLLLLSPGPECMQMGRTAKASCSLTAGTTCSFTAATWRLWAQEALGYALILVRMDSETPKSIADRIYVRLAVSPPHCCPNLTGRLPTWRTLPAE